jgi:hypothetical protein
MKMKFLGTCGGRYAMGQQKRQSGGIILESDETQIHIDPGPGALVQAHEQEVAKDTEAVLVSHGHVDHSNDAEALTEMMVEAYNHAGFLMASESVLSGFGDIEKRVSDYHQDLCGEVKKLGEGVEAEFKGLEIRTQEMFHSDPKTVGFTVDNGDKKFGFWTDTEYSDELVDFYEGCDTLVVYCSRPKNEGTRSHTSLDDIPEITEKLDVSKVVVTHFGFKFLESDLEAQKNWLEEQVDPGVVFADDGMDYPGNRKLDAF